MSLTTWGENSDFCLSLKGLGVADSGVVFTLFRNTVTWETAKSNCEAEGQRLAILDTEEKRSAFQAQK